MSEAGVADRVGLAWDALRHVLDPEVPALSVCDLGIVRDVSETEHGITVVLTPTYSGCPATEVIAAQVREALQQAGCGDVHIEHRLAPAWTSDWISAEGHRKLLAAGIAPPGACATDRREVAARPIRMHRNAALRGPGCPRCASERTERLSAFGSTACKSLYRCLDCREPFEHFKAI